MNKIMQQWYKPDLTLLTLLLLPLSWVFCGIVWARRWLYRHGVFKKTKFPVKVIVVGNITVGGTGKTPLVIALCHYLQKKGHKPGVVLRGFGARVQGVHIVEPNDAAKTVGDEALLIKRRAGCPVVIGKQRVNAVRTLLKNFGCDIVVSDDGLQHYALERDIEIAVIDGARRFGNGLRLPAGPLREPLSRLKNVDLLVCHGQTQGAEFSLELKPECIVSARNFVTIKPIEEFTSGRVHAVAGIGNPARFFNLCQSLAIHAINHAFADHYEFLPSDIDLQGMVIMTEKDAVKCQPFADERHWFLRVSAVLPPSFFNQIEELIHEKR